MKNPASSSARRVAGGLACAAALLAVPACARPPADPASRAEFESANDPAEPTNRVIFAGNQFVDRNALQPVARGYKDYIPDPTRKGLHNFVSNLGQPSVAVNDALQGNFGRAWNTTERFVINTTLGGAGLFDVATDWDRPGHPADFGQTLGVWGVGTGPTVQLPLLGSSNARDAVGMAAGMLTNPLQFVPGGAATAMQAASGGAGLVDGRANLLSASDSLERTSLDYYATVRSATAQRRASLVDDGKTGLVAGAPDGARPQLSISTTTTVTAP
jgi:phospholipid-binding lipoprotein MlaA